MTNPLTKKIPNNHAYYLILIALILAGIWTWSSRLEITQPTIIEPANAQTIPSDKPSKVEAEQPSPVKKVQGILTPKNSYKMRVTAFSDVECGSKWCNRHEVKDGQIALNYAKYGRASKVYIPAYDKTYRVVGNTDGNTDLDIWFGDDQQSAKQFGSKELLVQIIK